MVTMGMDMMMSGEMESLLERMWHFAPWRENNLAWQNEITGWKRLPFPLGSVGMHFGCSSCHSCGFRELMLLKMVEWRFKIEEQRLSKYL